MAKVLATTNSEPGLALKQLHYDRALFIPLIEDTSSSTSPDGRSISGRDLLQNLCIKIDPKRLLITFDVVRILSLQEKKKLQINQSIVKHKKIKDHRVREGKDQKSIKSSVPPDPGHHIGK